jgi:cell pole-organizing protein PopZ
MAQPNVVREPSMDEILASIRRIIESNDPVPSGIASSMPEPEGFSGSAANDDMEDVPLTIDDTFAPLLDARHDASRAAYAPSNPGHLRDEQIEPMPEARLHAAQQAEDAALPAAVAERETAPQAKSLSLADVAARVRAASERNPGLRDLAPRAVEEDAAPAVTQDVPLTSPLMTGRMAAAGGVAQPQRQPIDWNDIAPTEERVPAQQPKVELEKLMAQPAAPQASASEPVTSNSLISVDAGHQVARSFQDLAVAIDEAERRSYDDIAADLLRPMLQEWLDENLPTLVERLVREEIERVARGTRR